MRLILDTTKYEKYTLYYGYVDGVKVFFYDGLVKIDNGIPFVDVPLFNVGGVRITEKSVLIIPGDKSLEEVIEEVDKLEYVKV